MGGELQGQTTRVEMGVNDAMIHFIETRLQDLVDHLLHKHLQGLLVVWLTTSGLAHKVVVGNQAGHGVVVWVSIDNGANVATKVEGAFLGWNRIDINEKL